MPEGVGLGGLDFLQKIWSGFSPSLQVLLEMDFKNMTLKDYVTLVGFVYTAGKAAYAVYGMAKLVNVHGVSKVLKPNLKKKFGEWAVVTGCTHGIGEAYVHELAAAGMSIVLLTNQQVQLRELAQKIEQKYKVKTEQIIVDNHQTSRYNSIQEQLDGKEIGILMNNVGINEDTPANFTDLDNTEIFNTITRNILPTTMMTHMLLPQMIERGRGAVIIVAAGGLDNASPQRTLYGSTKAYLSHFAESLYEEYKDQGVTVQCLTPYKVATSDSHMTESMLVPSSSHYAKSALSTLGYSHRTTGCLSHSFQGWVNHMFPPWIRHWIMESFYVAMQETASEKLGVDLESLEGPKLADGSRPLSGSLAAFLEGMRSIG